MMEPGIIGFLIITLMSIVLIAQCYIAHKHTDSFESS